MSKVIKSFSLDIDTVRMLEEYSSSMEDWNTPSWSRSKVVNDAIRWFLTGDVAEQIHSHEALLERYTALLRERDGARASIPSNRPWWKQLLGL